MRYRPLLRRADRRARTGSQSGKSPLELELWRIARDGCTLSCELRCDSTGWDVLMRSNGEALFSRRCQSEEHGPYVATGLKQDEVKADWTQGSGRAGASRDS